MGIRSTLAAFGLAATTFGSPVNAFAQPPDPTYSTTAPATNSGFSDNQYARFAPYLNIAKEKCGASDDEAKAALLSVFKQGWLYAGQVSAELDRKNNNAIMPGKFVAMFYASKSDPQHPTPAWEPAEWVLPQSKTFTLQAADVKDSLASTEDCSYYHIRALGFARAAELLQSNLDTYEALTKRTERPATPAATDRTQPPKP